MAAVGQTTVPSTPLCGCHAFDRQVNFLDLGAPPTIFQGKLTPVHTLTRPTNDKSLDFLKDGGTVPYRISSHLRSPFAGYSAYPVFTSVGDRRTAHFGEGLLPDCLFGFNVHFCTIMANWTRLLPEKCTDRIERLAH
jgi:hypothetical protein